MYGDPATWHALLDKLATVIGDYLRAQVLAGAQAVQLFDSWVGCLSPGDYETYVLPHSRRVLHAAQATRVPVIHFGTGTGTFLPALKRAGGDVIGLDWRTPLDWGWRQLGDDVAVQGNLDPLALFAPPEERERQVRAVLDAAGGRPGHIFNLGHGILPETPVSAVQAVVEQVHAETVREAA
jgi:uroporphyrinogen decarboxylase